MSVPPSDNVPPVEPGGPRDPWHRRYWNSYWGYTNRPYAGCGCLWLILWVIFIWWLIAILWWPGGWWGWRRW